MRFKRNKVGDKKPWEKVFAYLPVDIDRETVWLEYVWRQGRYTSFWFEEGWDYEYRKLEDKPND